jgi:putative flavoprotein involved in K+ transport
MEAKHQVVVVGGGQAGLAVSHELTDLRVEHVVLERARVAQTWRDRWDSFCLVTPNWSVKLPGGAYAGDYPDGFMPRDDIVRHLEAYATSFEAPLREGVEVTSIDAAAEGGFALTTSQGMLRADGVVLATGAYQRPHRPPGAATLPAHVLQIDAEAYRNEASLPPGRVLVVGSGQTGCQLAEELNEAGRAVVLACGRAPWCSRRIGEKDVIFWAVETGSFDDTPADLPSPAARLGANIQATGHGGGHDLHYRTLQQMGVTLVGHFLGAEEGRIHFADDLSQSVAFGDARYNETRQKVTKLCSERGLHVPEMPDPTPFDARAPDSIDVNDLAAVIFTSGFRPDYASWIHFDAFDDMGFPIHQDGASTVVPGLYYCGVHFLRKRKSSLLFGVGEDATIVTRKVATGAQPR